MDIGEKIKQLRDENDITQEDLGKHLKIHRSTVANYESGNRQPDIETCKQIAEYFGVSIDFLVGKKQKKYRDFIYDAKTFFSSDSVTEAEKDRVLKKIIDCYFESKTTRQMTVNK